MFSRIPEHSWLQSKDKNKQEYQLTIKKVAKPCNTQSWNKNRIQERVDWIFTRTAKFSLQILYIVKGKGDVNKEHHQLTNAVLMNFQILRTHIKGNVWYSVRRIYFQAKD